MVLYSVPACMAQHPDFVEPGVDSGEGTSSGSAGGETDDDGGETDGGDGDASSSTGGTSDLPSTLR